VSRISIRAKLTFWFSLSLFVIVAGLGIAAHFAMTVSADRAVDQELTLQADGICKFLSAEAPGLRAAEVDDELREMTQDGTLLLVTDEKGAVIFRSADWHLENLPFMSKAWGGTETHTVKSGKHLDRIAITSVESGGHLYFVTLSRSLREYRAALDRFELGLLILTPLALALAAAGGYWLSARALAPVNGIISKARTIGVHNLSARLPLPRARDELYDLTETINAMLDRIERSVEQIQQFTADASHEMRSPLTLIRTAADFSLRRQRDAGELTDALHKILREAERMSRLVDSLLLLSRADSGIFELHPTVTNLGSVLEQAAEQVKPLSRERGISLDVNLPVNPIEAIADEDALSRVAFILLDNAVKYTAEGGRVTVSAGETDESVWFTVADNGIGISKQDLPKVFDRFWRADPVRSRAKGGVGLGLSIALNIVEKHVGRITVDSIPGSGSKFTVNLPAAHTTASRTAVL
jgi:heavy metal sensor kinase